MKIYLAYNAIYALREKLSLRAKRMKHLMSWRNINHTVLGEMQIQHKLIHQRRSLVAEMKGLVELNG